jgi:uncharacterized protein (TIGR00251 family)
VAGTRVRLRVVPGATKPGIVGRHGDAWKVRVSSPPERGAANHSAVGFVAAVLGVGARDVRLVSGHSARDKIVELTSLTADEVERRLAQANGKDG